VHVTGYDRQATVRAGRVCGVPKVLRITSRTEPVSALQYHDRLVFLDFFKAVLADHAIFLFLLVLGFVAK
jgi:hypothetical protein